MCYPMQQTLILSKKFKLPEWTFEFSVSFKFLVIYELWRDSFTEEADYYGEIFCFDVKCRGGIINFPLSFNIVLGSLRIKLTKDRLTGENNI